MSLEFIIIIISTIVAVSCALPGVFLVLRGVALLSDAVSHAILLGIVVMFLIVGRLDSIWLIIGAALSGLLTVFLTELLINTKRIKKDAAIGLVFPVFFSLGVIAITRFADHIHLDADAVLLGELALAPFNRLIVFGTDFGPYSLWSMGIVLVLNTFLMLFAYKELKLSTFDPGLARALGLSPILIHYGLMTMTSITAVVAFDSVGSILVVALMITPPATAYLLTSRCSTMIFYSVGFAILSAWFGYGLAALLDVSIAGSSATMTGVFFIIVLILSPEKGLWVKYKRSRLHRVEFSAQLLGVQLLSHEGSDNECVENTVTNMLTHMQWDTVFANKVLRYAVQKQWIIRDQDQLRLTPLGREVVRSIMVQ